MMRPQHLESRLLIDFLQFSMSDNCDVISVEYEELLQGASPTMFLPGENGMSVFLYFECTIKQLLDEVEHDINIYPDRNQRSTEAEQDLSKIALPAKKSEEHAIEFLLCSWGFPCRTLHVHTCYTTQFSTAHA